MKILNQLILPVLLATALSACGNVKQDVDEAALAAQLAAEGNYSAAVNYMLAAIEKSPDNQAYVKQLDEYKLAYARALVLQGRAVLAQLITASALSEVDGLLDEIKSLQVDDTVYANFEAQFEKTKNAFEARLDSDYARLVSSLSTGNWVLATELYEQFLLLAPDYLDVKSKYTETLASFRKTSLEQASDHIKRDEISEAIEVLRSLLIVDPNNGIAQSLLNSALEKNTATYYLGKVDQAHADEQWERIIWLCSRVLRYSPADSKCSKLSQQARSEIFEKRQRFVLDSLKDGYVYQAANTLIELEDYLSEKNVRSYAELKDRVIKATFRAAEQAVDVERYGLAWNLLNFLITINPALREVDAEIRDVNDELEARARRQIAVLDFKSPSNNPDAGVIVANVLRSTLFKNASRDIVILERDNVTSILEEMKLGQIGVVSDKTARAMGEMYGLDYTIMGSVLLFKVDSAEAKSSKTAKYKVGEEIVDNIEFLNWKSANPNAKAADFKTAPQAKIVQEVFDYREYDVVTQKKVAFLSLSFRMVDIKTGENTRVDTIEQRKRVEDESNQGVSEAGIKFDPLEMPTDTELLQALSEEVVADMATEILRPLQSLEKFYFEKAQEYDRRGETKDAIEYYMLAIVDEQLKTVASSPITEASRQRIDEILMNTSL